MIRESTRSGFWPELEGHALDSVGFLSNLRVSLANLLSLNLLCMYLLIILVRNTDEVLEKASYFLGIERKRISFVEMMTVMEFNHLHTSFQGYLIVPFRRLALIPFLFHELGRILTANEEVGAVVSENRIISFVFTPTTITFKHRFQVRNILLVEVGKAELISDNK